MGIIGSKMTKMISAMAALAVSVCFASLVHAGALHDAVRSGDEAAFDQALDTSTDLNESDFLLGSPLHLAISVNKVGYVKRLIDRGANLEAESELGSMRALHLAADFGYPDIAGLLLQSGAESDALAANGETPLIVAARSGSASVVQLLIDHGAQLEIKEDTEGLTPLAMAALHGNLDAASQLLDAGADIEATSKAGRSVVFLACLFQSYKKIGDGALIRLLAERGADIDRKDDAGYTPLSYALTRPNVAYKYIADILRELGAEE